MSTDKLEILFDLGTRMHFCEGVRGCRPGLWSAVCCQLRVAPLGAVES
jgi:hypothetical protein